MFTAQLEVAYSGNPLDSFQQTLSAAYMQVHVRAAQALLYKSVHNIFCC